MTEQSTADSVVEAKPDMAAQEALKAAKKKLRELMTAQITQVSGQSVASQSTIISDKLLSSDVFKRARSVSIYLSMLRGEVMTRRIVKEAFEAGKEVYVPYIVPAKKSSAKDPTIKSERARMDMVSLHSISDFRRCEENRDKWGIPSIRPTDLQNRKCILGATDNDSQGTSLDLIVMPGLAFDLKCRRLGHGKGFYDEFLSRYRGLKVGVEGSKANMPSLVGVGLMEQLVPAYEVLPVNDDDWPLDALILGDSSLLIREKSALGERQSDGGPSREEYATNISS